MGGQASRGQGSRGTLGSGEGNCKGDGGSHGRMRPRDRKIENREGYRRGTSSHVSFLVLRFTLFQREREAKMAEMLGKKT